LIFVFQLLGTFGEEDKAAIRTFATRDNTMSDRMVNHCIKLLSQDYLSKDDRENLK
jgi:hypothetical protein